MSSTARNSNGQTGAFPQDIRHLISEVFCVYSPFHYAILKDLCAGANI